jgi:hypothetical protein
MKRTVAHTETDIHTEATATKSIVGVRGTQNH